MHELAIAQGIVETVRERIPEATVTTVRLAVGRLSGVCVDSVRFCFELAAEGTNLAGASLVVEEPAGRMLCSLCGAEFDCDHLYGACACGNADLEAVAGTELLIRSVEVRKDV